MIEQLSILENIDSAEPILQWMGGKKRLFNEIYKRFPKEFNRYYEPFIGGGFIAKSSTTLYKHSSHMLNAFSVPRDVCASLLQKSHFILF